MRKSFVVISGLPGSGKTKLGRRLAPALDLPLIDKDAILDRLFQSKVVADAAWRRTLSRESDVNRLLPYDRSLSDCLAAIFRMKSMPHGSSSTRGMSTRSELESWGHRTAVS
jgi:AAA domain